MISLTARQSFVLSRVVDTFIQTGSPVSSRSVAVSSPERVSSATVRNEMGVLEETGHLIQAHLSSGRIPTDLGYRHYLDHGMDVRIMNAFAFRDLSSRFQGCLTRESMPLLAEDAASALSEHSHELGVFLAPNANVENDDDTGFKMTAQGLRYLFEKPECHDAKKLKPLIRAVEEKKKLKKWIDQNARDRTPRAFVGSEHSFEDLADYAIVTARYGCEKDGTSGAIAVIGWKRMVYAEVLPVVAGMADWMNRALNSNSRES